MLLLLRAARRRAKGRERRQQELFRNRARKKSRDAIRVVGTILSAVFGIIVNLLVAFAVYNAVHAGQRVEVERTGKLVVGADFIHDMGDDPSDGPSPSSQQLQEKMLDASYRLESMHRAQTVGGLRQGHEDLLREFMRTHTAADLVDEDVASPGLRALARTGPLPAMLGSLLLLGWLVMMVFQGEGLELDLQRRRHPMWEWLFSHPVGSGPVFLAEMLSPIAANPTYWGAPLFCAALYYLTYGRVAGVAALFLIGIPLTIATASVGKALEIGAMLRPNANQPRPTSAIFHES